MGVAMRYVVIGCAAVLAAVCVVSAASKARSRSAFVAFIASAGLLLPKYPRSLAVPIAWAVLGAEVAVTPLLFLAPIAGFALAAVLLLGFCGTVALAVHKGVREPCRCFGAGAAPLGYRHAVRAGALGGIAVLGGAGAVALAVRGAAGLFVGADPGGVAVAVAVATVLVAVTVRLDDLVDLFSTPAYRSGNALNPVERI